ncbi:MAG: hypothetical protein GW939_01515 [Candidatus Magasanikbacteria bacterium]|nr:hypothetical protein [Candidatus Magasanikbacteria bacterium]NCS71985.1 hypothetical protein [Candidatus Magasanikbacteria bacterium]
MIIFILGMYRNNQPQGRGVDNQGEEKMEPWKKILESMLSGTFWTFERDGDSVMFSHPSCKKGVEAKFSEKNPLSERRFGGVIFRPTHGGELGWLVFEGQKFSVALASRPGLLLYLEDFKT